jgi:hypothetical protein
MTAEDEYRMSSDIANTEQLAALVAAKLQVLKVLVQLSRRQTELIDAGEMTILIKLLAAKQTVMNQLQTLEKQLEPFRDEDPEQRRWQTPAQRATCQAQAQSASGLLAEALELEQQAETAMLRRRDNAAAALAAVQAASDARGAYVTGPVTIHSMHAEG